MHISYSRVSCYLSCPYRHFLSYVEKLELRRPVRPLYFGTDFHKLLELRKDKAALKQARMDIADKFYEMPAAWQADMGENYPQDLWYIFKDYQKVYKDAILPTSTEEKFEIPLFFVGDEQVFFVGVIDELYKRKRKGRKYIKIGEHKTFNRKPDPNFLIMNTQKSLYSKAVQILYGILPDSVIWDYIKSTPAKPPIWLPKSNRFSSSKSRDITPMSFRRECKRLGIDDPKVLKQATAYKDNISEFFFRREIDVLPEMTEQIWSDFLDVCEDIARRGEKNKVKNVTRDCSFCSYRDICHAELTGGSRDEIIKLQYQPKEGRN